MEIIHSCYQQVPQWKKYRLRQSSVISSSDSLGNVPQEERKFYLSSVGRFQHIKFGVILPVELINEDIRDSKAYKEYYAVASGAAPPKTKASVKKTKSSFDTIITPPTTAGTRLLTSAKGKKPAKASKAKSLTVLSEVAMTEAEQIKLATKRSLQQTHISQASGSGTDEGTEEEAKNEGSFDPIIQTPENSDDEGNDDASLGLNVGREEGQDAEDDEDELYRDFNINLEGRDVQMEDVHTTQEFVDTHVTLTSVNPDGIDSLFETTPQMNVPASTAVASLTLTAPTLPPLTIPTSSQTLEANFSEFVQTNQFDRAVSSIPMIVQRYMNQRMNKAVKIIKEQVKEQVNVQVSKILPKIEKTVNEQLEAEVLTQSSNSSNTSYVVAADLSEIELKKILIKKMESNKYIHRSDEQSNLYKALVEAYESDKIILDTYGDTVTLKRRHDNADKDEEPSAGSDRGSKTRRERKEPESTSAPKKKAAKTTSKSTQGSKSHQQNVSESTPAEEPMQINKDLEECTSQSRRDLPRNTTLDRVEVLDTLTPELLAGPTYELMKGSCKSLVELEFFLEEVYKATTNQLDWNNPEGQQYPCNLLKPLPLIPNSRGRHVIPFDHFINNDLEYLRGGASNRKYITSVTKIKAADYGHIKESLIGGANVNSSIDLQSTGSLLEMSTLNVESSLSPNFRFSSGTIRSIWIGSRCQKLPNKLNLIKPDTYCSDLKHKEAYTAYSNPRGFIYQNIDKQNRLMRIDELHKFSDGMLNDVRTTLDDRLKGIRMKYLPQDI
nr:hypothetical protein [Tanacetum cinerariifolium]